MDSRSSRILFFPCPVSISHQKVKGLFDSEMVGDRTRSLMRSTAASIRNDHGIRVRCPQGSSLEQGRPSSVLHSTDSEPVWAQGEPTLTTAATDAFLRNSASKQARRLICSPADLYDVRIFGFDLT
jgi:hypothetical protein